MSWAWRDQKRTECSRCGLASAKQGGIINITWPAGCIPAGAAQDMVCFHCCKAILLTYTWHTLCEDFHVLFSRATLQPVLLLGIILSHVQDFTFICVKTCNFCWSNHSAYQALSVCFLFYCIYFSSYFGVIHKTGEGASNPAIQVICKNIE